MRPFNYTRRPLTCLWCGRKFTENYSTIRKYLRYTGDRPTLSLHEIHAADFSATPEWETPPPLPGYSYPAGAANRVRVATFHVGRGRARVTEAEATEVRVYYDPPIFRASWFDYDGTPLFDTDGCAGAFGREAAHHGYRLTLKQEGQP